MNWPVDYINKIIQGDCLEVMKGIPDKSIDLILTDPPYNAKNIGPDKKVYDNTKMQLSETEYIHFCKAWFYECQRISNRILMTPGIANTHNYPQPNWQICWSKPSAVSFNQLGGFNVWEPIFIYGKLPKNKRLPRDLLKYDIMNLTQGIEQGHPCPKQIRLWTYLVDIFSLESEVILDPFLGSGTTAVACKDLDRKYIGIEISEKYCDIARKRVERHIPNLRLFP